VLCIKCKSTCYRYLCTIKHSSSRGDMRSIVESVQFSRAINYELSFSCSLYCSVGVSLSSSALNHLLVISWLQVFTQTSLSRKTESKSNTSTSFKHTDRVNSNMSDNEFSLHNRGTKAFITFPISISRK